MLLGRSMAAMVAETCVADPLRHEKKIGSASWMPGLRLLTCSVTPPMQSSTGTRRPINKRRFSSGSSLAALELLGLLGGSSPLRKPAPHIGRHRNRVLPLMRPHREAEVRGDILCRGPLDRNRICGLLFRLEIPWRRSPDVCGAELLRAAPTWMQRCPPHHMVPVSPQCPQGIGLLTLPVFQGTQRASLSVFSTRRCSGAEKLASSSEVSRTERSVLPCRASGHRSSCSNYTRDQSQETDSLSRLLSSMEYTAQCVSVGPAHNKGRSSY